MKIDMTFTKSTKNTHVYASKEDDAAIPTLYIKKDKMPSTPPAEIKVSIEFDE